MTESTYEEEDKSGEIREYNRDREKGGGGGS